jgi:hypothetical protein
MGILPAPWQAAGRSRHRSRELIPAKAKAFRAEAQSRREHKENKAVIYFKSLRLCVSARV